MPFASTHLFTGFLSAKNAVPRCTLRLESVLLIDGETLDDYVSSQIAQLQTSKDYLKLAKQDTDEPYNIALHKNKYPK